MTSFVDLDVRTILRDGGEPFGLIMSTVAGLRPGQGLRLLAPFKPVPLFAVLQKKGYSGEANALDGGDWEVLFTPDGAADTAEESPAPAADAAAAADAAWPEPVRVLDDRDLMPPEPMVRILAALEGMAPGEVLAARLNREPVFLLPELDRRGHAWRGGFEEGSTTYALRVRVGRPVEKSA